MLKQFGDTGDPDTAHSVAWTCLLAPDAVPDLSIPVQLAKEAVAQKPDSGNYRNTLGGIFRARRFQEALNTLDAVVARWQNTGRGPSRYSSAYTYYFLGMVHYRLDHTDEARTWIEKAHAQAESQLNSKKQFAALEPPGHVAAFPQRSRATDERG